MISSIYLCNCKKLTTLPNSIGKLQKLKTLNLAHCEELKCLPDAIGDCHMISSIDLFRCMKLTVLPNSIGKLQKLKTLNLSQCEVLKCLPASIGGCHMISSIDICNCKKIAVLPDSIGRNEKLRALILCNTNIERLPTSITTLRNLECLDLYNCWKLVELPEGISNLEKLQVLNLQKCNNLGGMPVGIGQLTRLQKLGLFVLCEGEQFAGLSELANVPGVGEELSIRVISHGVHPNATHKACLNQKTNLQRLDLQWMAHDVVEVNNELVQAVLDGLEPPPEIKELEICGYSGRQNAGWMQNQIGRPQRLSHFPFLRLMKLYDLPNLKKLHGLVQLPCLEELWLELMPALESISGGPFPSLVKLVFYQLPSLGEVWMVAEGTLPDGKDGEGCSNYPKPHLGQVRLSNFVSNFRISSCPRLEVKPYLPSSLQHLLLSGSSEQLLQSPGQCQGSSLSPSFSHLTKLELYAMTGLGPGRDWELLQHMTALESLEIHYSDALTELPKGLRSLTSLQSLEVNRCSAICNLPEWLGELWCLQELTITFCRNLSTLPQSTGHLTSLQVLHIGWCDALHQLPECLGELCSLRELKITELTGLTCLPQSMCGLTSLQELWIDNCPGIKSLPQEIKGLRALHDLWIRGCPHLARRCKRGEGEDWDLISHVPCLQIGELDILWPDD
jgi:Leucine-rich repeat (LRR) protein